jgi:hypothetical protein
VFELKVKIQIAFFRAYNRIERAVCPRNFTERKETFPFVSCDSYALRCDFALQRFVNEEELDSELENMLAYSSIYLPTRFAERASNYFLDRKKIFKKIVLGDDDKSLHEDAVKKILRATEKLYGINVYPNLHVMNPLPIGLESPNYRSGGRLRDFSKRPNNSVNKRKLSFLVAWNQSTNILKREIASLAFQEAQDTFMTKKRIPAQVVHKLMRKSLFVPCPQGNGLDTHRIWETIFLGAVPVVLKQDAFSALEGWPILFVESWSEVTLLPREELEEIYRSIIWDHEEVLEKSKDILKEIEA